MEEELEETSSLRHRSAASRHHHHQRRRAKKPPPTKNYDDVFGGPPRHAVPFSGVPDDYSEVFGGVSVSCSIPFLDLPTAQMDGWDCASGDSVNGVDYREIFGRCDFADFAVPYEELFGRGNGDEGDMDMHFSPASANGRSSIKGRSGPQTIDPSVFIQESSNEDSIPYLDDLDLSVSSSEIPKEYNTSYNKASRAPAKELLHTPASVPQPQTGFTFVVEPNKPLPEHLTVVTDDTITHENSVKPNPRSSANSQSISNRELVPLEVPFPDVSDINLQVRSANLPPPARPPAPKFALNDRQKTNTFLKNDSVLNFSTETKQLLQPQQEKPKTFLKSDSLPPNFDFVPNLKLDKREKPKLKSRPNAFSKSDSLPPDFGSELDAMKEAMEFAQARLKTAKELHEKRREGKITELPLKKKHVKEENLEGCEREKPRVLRSISLASNFSKSREFMKVQGEFVASQSTPEWEKSGKWRSDGEFHELTSIGPTKVREDKVGSTGTEPLGEANKESMKINGLALSEVGLSGNLIADVNNTEHLELSGEIKYGEESLKREEKTTVGSFEILTAGQEPVIEIEKEAVENDTQASKEDANVIPNVEERKNTEELEAESEDGKGSKMEVGTETEKEDGNRLDEEMKRQRKTEELEQEGRRGKEMKEEEEEKERACKLEEEKERGLQLEEEKERAHILEEERKLQMEKDREEKERKERESIAAEEEERLEKEREEKLRKLAEERERERKLEEERKEEKMREKEMVRKLEEEKERERELEEEIEKERGRVRKLEEERAQERERVRKLEEEKQREREMAQKLEKEKEWERKLEEEIEKEREKIRKLEEERELEREKVRKLEEERELERERVRKLEEEREQERERVRKLEEEREKERIEKERERKRQKMEQEREQKERERIVKEREQKEMEKKLEEEKEKQRIEKVKEDRERQRRMEKEREEKEVAMRLEAEKRLEREQAEEMERMAKLQGEKAKDRKSDTRKSDEEKECEKRMKEKDRRTEGRKSDEEREKARERKSDEERERERERRTRKEREIEEREREEERKREREKDRLAVERATQERAERIAIERITAARQRAVENREKEEMNNRGGGEVLEKRRLKGEDEKKERDAERNAREARQRVERAAVERATTEARERAIEKAKAEAEKERDRLERYKSFNRISSQSLELVPLVQTEIRFSKTLDHTEESHFKRTQSDSALSQGNGESALRHKARLERQQRTAERAAKALAEKNRRDIMAQREQAERDRIAEHLDVEVKRWSSGKEGNLRALLSTLQYILGQNSGWQPIHLTEVITAADVKKAYRKATLYVHPDKLQQRGASIQQKYICEKVFDLLKEAWNRFNSEER